MKPISDSHFIDVEFYTIIVNKLTSMNRTIHKQTEGQTVERANAFIHH